MEIPSPSYTNTLLLSASEHCWCFGHLGKRVRTSGGHHGELGSFRETLQGRGWGSGREFIFPTNKQALHRKEILRPQDMVSLSSGRESSRWGRHSVTQRRGGGSMWSLSSEWGAAGKYNYPGFRVSSPMFPEKNQDSGGGIGPVSGGWQTSSKKMVERKGDVCNGHDLVVP